jgi:N-acetylglucosaminyldiphosphoundecaprenol N-acetyl-beta-D-mannosaminyltransferase
MVTVVANNSTAVFCRGHAPSTSAAPLREGKDLAPPATTVPDDLERETYCILGAPIDAIELAEAVRRISAAALGATPFLISTVNINFLATAAVNAKFREAVCLSDLCTADGMPIIWISRLLGIPIKRRVAGSDMFDLLRVPRAAGRQLKLFLFGGGEGAAAAAATVLNASPGGLHCVGSLNPGFGSVDDLSADGIVETINASGAQILIAALGAEKGQAWLLRNHHRLRPAIRSHLGAAINFAAGTVKRAPRILCHLGLEWLWRIKEEPHLWRRYAHDGGVLLRLFVTRVLPLAMAAQWRRLIIRKPQELQINEAHDHAATILSLSGDAIARYLPQAMSYFRQSIVTEKPLKIDLSSIRHIDARFFGLFLMLRKRLNSKAAGLKFIGITPRLARLFKLHGVEFLLSE